MSKYGLFNKPQYNEVPYGYTTGVVTSVEGKYHIKIEGIGFLLTHDVRSGRHNYGRDQAPTFVSKFGAGDPTYRDSSFFPHWVQLNWRNGAKQDEWDDEGRFLASQNIDVTKETKATLSKLLTTLSLSAGADVDVTCMAIDQSDSRKIFAGCSNGHVWRYSAGWSDLGDIATTGSGTAGRRVNCLLFSKIGLDGARATGEGQIYAGIGTPGTAGKAEILRYDGTWASAKTFTSNDAVTSLCEFNSEVYAGIGGVGQVYKASDANLATWTLSKDIDYPGYVWDLAVYNQRLYAACGNPENASTTYQMGTLWSYDGFLWGEVAPFMGTVLRKLCVYDNLLFIGTMHGQLYVYNRANIDLLYEMPDGQAITDMAVYDDKLYIATSYRTTAGTEDAIYIFDRAGTHKAHYDVAIVPLCLLVNGDELWIGGKKNGNAYKIDKTKYSATGSLESSYFNANLPNIDKVWFDVGIEMESLPASTKVEFYYKFDSSDANWTKVDETEVDGTTLAKFAFADGVYSKKLAYKIILTTTDNTKTPTIKKILVRYIIQPDFKYMWKFKVACPDNVEWLDETSPKSALVSSTASGATTVQVNDISGFPDPSGEAMYASIINDKTGIENNFSYTGISEDTLTGCVSLGNNSISSGATFTVQIKGKHFHRKILELKQRKAIIDFVDIDGTAYKAFIHDYTEDGWVMNQTAGLENEVSISLLQV